MPLGEWEEDDDFSDNHHGNVEIPSTGNVFGFTQNQNQNQNQNQTRGQGTAGGQGQGQVNKRNKSIYPSIHRILIYIQIFICIWHYYDVLYLSFTEFI